MYTFAPMTSRPAPLPSRDDGPGDRAIAWAQAALYREGPEAVTMNGAIAASRVSRRTLYKRIRSRDELVQRAVEATLRDLEAALAEAATFDAATALLRIALFSTAGRDALGFLFDSHAAAALSFHEALIAPASAKLEAWVRDRVGTLTTSRTQVEAASILVSSALRAPWRRRDLAADAVTDAIELVLRGLATRAGGHAKSA